MFQSTTSNLVLNHVTELDLAPVFVTSYRTVRSRTEEPYAHWFYMVLPFVRPGGFSENFNLWGCAQRSWLDPHR